MKLRTIIVIIGIVVLLSVLAFAVSAEKKEAEKLRIAYIRPTNEPYNKFGFDGAKMMADMMGVDILGYMSDMKPEKEIASVEDAITQQVDGIVLMSISASSLAAGISKAYNAGVPIFMISGYSSYFLDKMVGSVQADCNLSGGIMG